MTPKLGLEKCYFKILSESRSIEGTRYKDLFDVDFTYCLNSCLGYLNYSNCPNFASTVEIEARTKKIESYFKKNE